MPISIENNQSALELISSLSGEARDKSLKEYDPETILSEKISVEEALELAKNHQKIKGLLDEDEITLLSWDGKESFEIVRPINSVAEGLEAFGKYVKSSKGRIDQRIIQSTRSTPLNREGSRNVILSRALNSSVFLEYVKDLTGDPEVYKSLEDHVDLVTDLLIITDSYVLKTKHDQEIKCEVIGELTNYGLDDPAGLELIFDIARKLAPRDPNYLTELEESISGVKAEVITAYAISRVNTQSELVIYKASVGDDYWHGIDETISMGAKKGPRVLFIDIKKALNISCQGACLIHPEKGREGPIVTREGQVLGDIEEINMGIPDSIKRSVLKESIPDLVVRVDPELVKKTSLGDLLNDGFWEYNGLSSIISTEIDGILMGKMSKKGREND